MEYVLMVGLSNAALKSICTIPAKCALSNALCSVWTRTKVHHRYPDLSDKQTGWLEAHHSVPYIVQDEPTPGAQTPWKILMLRKLVGNLQQRRTVDLSELG